MITDSETHSPHRINLINFSDFLTFPYGEITAEITHSGWIGTTFGIWYSWPPKDDSQWLSSNTIIRSNLITFPSAFVEFVISTN